MLRPPIANKSLDLLPDGNILFELRRPFNDGTSHLKFTPLEFIEKLAALIPRPWANLIRYHGVFAPNAKLRSMIVRPLDDPRPNPDGVPPYKDPAPAVDPEPATQAVPPKKSTPSGDGRCRGISYCAGFSWSTPSNVRHALRSAESSRPSPTQPSSAPSYSASACPPHHRRFIPPGRRHHTSSTRPDR